MKYYEHLHGITAESLVADDAKSLTGALVSLVLSSRWRACPGIRPRRVREKHGHGERGWSPQELATKIVLLYRLHLFPSLLKDSKSKRKSADLSDVDDQLSDVDAGNMVPALQIIR